jgi:hypothetical protein
MKEKGRERRKKGKIEVKIGEKIQKGINTSLLPT